MTIDERKTTISTSVIQNLILENRGKIKHIRSIRCIKF